MESNIQDKGISISGNTGDIIGIGVSGNNNTFGKNIIIGSGTIDVSVQQLENLSPKYMTSLIKFIEKINSEIQNQKISEDERNEISNSIAVFAKELEDIKIREGKEDEISRVKKRELNGKLGEVIKTVLRALPTVTKVGFSFFAPLAPFSQIIGEKVEAIVNDYLQE